MAIWPSTLPRPQVAGYQVAPVDPAVRTDMEVGAARVRRRTAARNDQVSAVWRLTDAEMDVFRAWWDSAGAGAWFTGLSLALGDGGLTAVEARFVGTWQASVLPGLNWDVSARLEVR